MKISRVLACILVVMAICALAACHAGPSSSDADAAADLPELKIAVSTMSPFFYVDENGDYRGIDAEIATEACRRAGYQPVFVEVGWADRDEYLQNGSVDCLWNAFIKNDYRWTDAYMQSNLRAIVNIGDADDDLAAVKARGGVAVRVGSKLEEVLLDGIGLPGVPVYSCGTFEMAETAFIKGYTGALGGHELVLQRVMAEHPGQYYFLDGTIMAADLAVAFSKEGDSAQWQSINDAIDAMLADGTIEGIVASYSLDASVNASVEGGTSAHA